MKKMLLLVPLALALLSCHKDKIPVKVLYLSKVYKDALLEREIIYATDKKALRCNVYNTGSGLSVLNSFKLYGYDANGLLSDVTNFNAQSQFNSKYTLEYDANKRLTRLDARGDDNSIISYYLLEYDAGDHLSKYASYQTAGNKKTSEGRYTYGPQGTIAGINRYGFANNTPSLTDSSTFSFGTAKIPGHWTNFETLPLIALPNGDRYFFDMICDSSLYYFKDAPPVKTNLTFSGKTYNNEGYLTRQQVTSVRVAGLGVPVLADYEATYEYVE